MTGGLAEAEAVCLFRDVDGFFKIDFCHHVTLLFTSKQVIWDGSQDTKTHSAKGCQIRGCRCLDYLSTTSTVESNLWSGLSGKEFVGTYSQCSLTFAKDELIAISGVVRRIQSQTKDLCNLRMDLRVNLEELVSFTRIKPMLDTMP